jgi:Fur family ferric uptake transcriptional regulator
LGTVVSSTDSTTGHDDWHERLRSSGHRLTPQRELVLAAVERLGHATPDEVYAEVRTHSESINLSTVYRTLELLDDLGLIRHAHLTDRAPTYHSARGHEHAHLICRECQSVISIDRAEMEAALEGLAGKRGFIPDYGHLTVFGTCAECEQK